MFDIIGDIHGHAAELKSLLTRMDYKEQNGVWQHPSRKAIFVGDLIDRGPAIREVLHIVRNMIDHDQALAVMGNHEYNAIAYALSSPRTHS
jgi:predicted MPP superfamily phosphohydrolase